VLVVLAADQVVKSLVASRFRLGEVVPVVRGFFELTYALNAGGVWGLGNALPPGPRAAVFLILPVTITALAVWYAWTLPATERLRHVAIAMVVGGALGNLADRLLHSPPSVVDFLLFHVGKHYWPAFNVADSAICVGVGILMVATFLEEEDESSAPSASRA
jgi:signal peptidase II